MADFNIQEFICTSTGGIKYKQQQQNGFHILHFNVTKHLRNLNIMDIPRNIMLFYKEHIKTYT